MGKKVKTNNEVSFYKVIAFLITVFLAIVGFSANLEGLGVKVTEKGKKVWNIIFDIEAAKIPVFSKNRNRDSLFILLTRLDDYGLKKEEQEYITCFSRAVESAIGKIVLDHRLPIKTVFLRENCPINVQQALDLGNFNRADVVVWGKTKNFREGCLSDGIEINFEPTNTYGFNSFHKIRKDTSLLLENLSAYDVGDEFSILGDNTFYHWIQFYFNKKVGRYNLSKYRIPEGLARQEKIKWLFERAKLQNNKEANELALRDYSQILKLDVNNQLALSSQKKIYSELGKNEEVVKNLKEQLKLKPNSPELNYEIATEYYYNINNAEEALSYLEKAEKLGKVDSDLFNMKGNFYFTLGDKKKSVEFYNKAIEKKQTSIYYYNRGDAYKELKDYKKAIQDFSSSILTKENEDAYYKRSMIRYDLKEYDLALKDYIEYLRITDDEINSSDYNHLGNIYWVLGNYSLCEQYYSKAIELNDTLIGYYENRVDVYLKLDSLDDALKDYTRLIKFDSMNADRYFLRAQLYEDMDSIKSALHDYKRLIELDSLNAGRYLSRAYFYKDLDSVDNVIRDCKFCLSLDSLNIECSNLLGLAVNQKGNYKEAIEIFRQIINSDTIKSDTNFYAIVLNNISLALTNSGACQAGLDSINKALTIRPNDDYFFKNRGRALYCLGNYSKANSEFDKAIALSPEIQDFYGFRRNSRFYNWEFLGAYTDLIMSKSGKFRIFLQILPYLIIILALIFFFRKKIKNDIIPYLKSFLPFIYNFLIDKLVDTWSILSQLLIFTFFKSKKNISPNGIEIVLKE